MRNTGRRTATLAVVLAATAAVTATGMAGANTPVRENIAATHAVQSMSSAALTGAAIPTDFATVMGYTPQRLDGRFVNPGGDCSSPVPLPADFDNACKAHDLGYDLLRYATANNQELGPWARQSLDERLGTDMHNACDTRTDDIDRTSCHFMADVASAAVTGNSWRQGYVTPTKESLVPYALGGLGVVLMVGTAVFARRDNGGRKTGELS